MRRVRIPPPVVAVLVLFVTAVAWLVLSGALPDRRPVELKRDAAGQPLAELFTPREYAAFRAACPNDPLERYLYLALDAGREVDAVRAVPPDEHPQASEVLAFRHIHKSGGHRWPKDVAQHGPAVHRLRELEPHLAEPARSIAAAYLLYCDGKFDEAEAAFAALPAAFVAQQGRARGVLWLCRLEGFLHRGRWREAYRALEQGRVMFHILGNRLLDQRPVKTDQLVGLIRLHRETVPDDLLLPYYTAQVRYHQRRYEEVLEPSAEFVRRSLLESDERLQFSWWYYHEAMWHRHAVSLVLLGRIDEATGYVDRLAEQLAEDATARPRVAYLQDRVRLAIALHRGDAEAVEKLLASGPDAIWLAHHDEHLGPLFVAEKYAKLRKKYPPPDK